MLRRVFLAGRPFGWISVHRSVDTGRRRSLAETSGAARDGFDLRPWVPYSCASVIDAHLVWRASPGRAALHDNGIERRG
jgi:hypothetical protein